MQSGIQHQESCIIRGNSPTPFFCGKPTHSATTQPSKLDSLPLHQELTTQAFRLESAQNTFTADTTRERKDVDSKPQPIAKTPQIHSTLLPSIYTLYHPSSFSHSVSKLGGIIGIPFFSAPTSGSRANNACTSSSVSTFDLTRPNAARDGLSMTARNFSLRALPQDDSSWSGDEACELRIRVRMVEREEASAMPDARPRPA
jgi:hypothetical protein